MKKTYLYATASLLFFAIFFLLSCDSQALSSETKKERAEHQEIKIDQINKLVASYAEYGEFNGAVLVANEGKILYQKAFGFANMELDVPNKTNTKFRIASITKQFTAMLIVQLVSENKLDLHKPISSYLPDYPKENGDKITLHHLLTHTSGIPNNYESAKPNREKQDMVIPDNFRAKDLVNEFSALPLEFNPGKKFSYCNAGYTLLGFIVEEITRKPYEQLLQERIFDPLQMKNSGFDKHRAIQKNRASGYFKSWGEYYNANYIDMSKVYAAGALYTTVEDLFLWDQALYTEQLVSKKYLDIIFTSHVEDAGYGGFYGYGWNIKNKSLGSSEDYVETIVHDGVIDGFCAIITRIPSSKSSVILLSNVRRAPLNTMTKAIMGIMYDKPYDLPKKSLAYALLDVINDEGIEKGIAFYESVKNNSTYYSYEDEMNIISYKLLTSNRAEMASEVLQLAIKEYPEAFNLYDSMGEIQRKLGNKTESIFYYKKSVTLNPKNENGIKMLKELGVDTENMN